MLGLESTATDKEIKLQYYRLAQTYHPDKNESGDGSAYLEIQFAYRLLTDPYKRNWYEKEHKLVKEGRLLNDFEKSFMHKS